MEELETLATGSTRSKVEERYDLIPPEGLRRLSLRYALGAHAHGEGNWTKGQPPKVILNHMLRHLEHYRAGDREDDDLAAVAWGCFALMHFEKHMPELWTPADDPFGTYTVPIAKIVVTGTDAYGHLTQDMFPVGNIWGTLNVTGLSEFERKVQEAHDRLDRKPWYVRLWNWLKGN